MLGTELLSLYLTTLFTKQISSCRMEFELLFPTELPVEAPLSWQALQERLNNQSLQALLTGSLTVDALINAVEVDEIPAERKSLFLDYFCTVGKRGSFESILPRGNSPWKIHLQPMISPIKKELKAKHLNLPFKLNGRAFYMGKVRQSCQLFLVFPPPETSAQVQEHSSSGDGGGKTTMIDQSGWENLNNYIFELFSL